MAHVFKKFSLEAVGVFGLLESRLQLTRPSLHLFFDQHTFHGSAGALTSEDREFHLFTEKGRWLSAGNSLLMQFLYLLLQFS